MSSYSVSDAIVSSLKSSTQVDFELAAPDAELVVLLGTRKLPSLLVCASHFIWEKFKKSRCSVYTNAQGLLFTTQQESAASHCFEHRGT